MQSSSSRTLHTSTCRCSRGGGKRLIKLFCCCCAGHGGPNAADYVRSNLFINLLEHTKFATDISSALGEQCQQTAPAAEQATNISICAGHIWEPVRTAAAVDTTSMVPIPSIGWCEESRSESICGKRGSATRGADLTLTSPQPGSLCVFTLWHCPGLSQTYSFIIVQAYMHTIMLVAGPPHVAESVLCPCCACVCSGIV